MSDADWDPYGGDAHLTPVFGRLRLRTLVMLRWLAVIGQTLTVLLVHFVLGFELPLGFCLGVILTSAWINTWLTLAVQPQQFAQDWQAFAQLAYDVLQLCVLLMLTGGLQNPFVVMLAAPVTIAVAALPPRWSLPVAAIAMAGTGAMWLWSLPLPWLGGEELHLPGMYIIGLWAAIFVAVAFTAVYSWRVSQEGRSMATALAATQSVLSREQRLSALGALAAAAAHELGTPLATIQLTAKEMMRELKDDEILREDAELLVTQARRCRDILKRLTAEKTASDERHDRVEFLAALEEAAAPLRGMGPMVDVHLEGPENSTEPVLRRIPELLYGIGNFIENAVDFAATRVTVEGHWSDTDLTVSILDDGPGFTLEILSKIGEPYVTTRSGTPGQGGLGLGVFIAKTMIEKTGGTVRFENSSAAGGALVTIVWPREKVEAGPILR
ncbi:MAG: ActS/PrrB/RegB family redox-sensitive histidine kinase [Maricaulis sp.]|jgi:two-component system sensor histidine kinase RegB|uniref:ActS/PrrB/RegB family redox-sensitive histidine kinase n=1 Tax=Maricaulis sp. TaxID=1486257 RepID=UPI001AFDF7F7|nr:ActS/PrrB/RegB family redox-sensitive histidine kinase [Maricaulis sp.]MBO6846317.1 ActS/PrrB/RegB family redox-sensitive histidine kinase [Maricaulis sp.]MBO6875806.1 ActS/PrrB/RegB family redox-sensitive histidine kinase [Maricaulis sp.]MDM7984286.1 ActS/PrrB/RegB family redox-sensitive histidine kinase [Maricaulis sp.]